MRFMIVIICLTLTGCATLELDSISCGADFKDGGLRAVCQRGYKF